MEIQKHRAGLPHTLSAIKNKSLTIGFIGGSITDGRSDCNWPEPVCAWFVESFPDVRIQIENAAIGATGSDLAVFRAKRDLIDRGCDLVFVEFAVNDDESPAEQRMRSREGLVRKLLHGKECDIVFTYTYRQSMYADMIAGHQPSSIADFEQLAEHYQIGSVWMGLNALQEVMRGLMRWEEWLPDGLHPQSRGSLSYGQSVIRFMERELQSHPSKAITLTGMSFPAPLNPKNWEHAHSLPLTDIRLEGPWTVRRWVKLKWIDQVLHTTAVGAKLSFEFEGRALMLGLDFGKNTAEFRYRIDNGDWKLSGLDRPDWACADGWYRLFLLADDLPVKRHHVELEVLHGNPSGDGCMTPRYTGTTLNLALVGVVP